VAIWLSTGVARLGTAQNRLNDRSGRREDPAECRVFLVLAGRVLENTFMVVNHRPLCSENRAYSGGVCLAPRYCAADQLIVTQLLPQWELGRMILVPMV